MTTSGGLRQRADGAPPAQPLLRGGRARADRDGVTNEIRLGASGLVDPDKAAEIGKLLAVKYLVYGDVQEHRDRQGLASAISSVIGGGILGGKVRVKGTHCRTHVNYKMVEVETDKIVLSRTFKEIMDVTHVVDGPESPAQAGE